MVKRTITALIASGYVIAMVWLGSPELLGRWVLVVNLVALLLVGTHEMLATLKSGGFHPMRWLYYLYVLLLTPAYLLFGNTGLVVMVMAGLLASMASVALRTEPDAREMLGALLPAFYPALPIMAMGMILLGESEYWRMMSWTMFALPIGSDAFALFFGKAFGKHKLIPKVSPNKTVGGAAAGVLGALFSAMIVYGVTVYHGENLSIWIFIGLGLLASVVNQVGDIVASYIKRFCGVKDFGRLFPGHGGLLDRLDSIMYCAVALCIVSMLTAL